MSNLLQPPPQDSATKMLWLTQRYTTILPQKPKRHNPHNNHHTLHPTTLKILIEGFQITHSYFSTPLTCPIQLTQMRHNMQITRPRQILKMNNNMTCPPNRQTIHPSSNTLACLASHQRRPYQYHHIDIGPQR